MARTTRLRGSLLVLISLVPLFHWSQDALSALVQPKRPPSAYMLWLSQERPKIVENLGTNAVTKVSKEAGKMWGEMSATEKTPFEKEASALKEEYEKEKAAFLEQGGVITRKTKNAKTGPKKNKDPNAPKRPMSSYFLWLQDQRASIVKTMPKDHRQADVLKKAGEMWKGIKAADKTKYEKMAEEERAKYAKLVEEYKKTLGDA